MPGALRRIVVPVACAWTALALAALATPGLWRLRDSGPDTAIYAHYGSAVDHGLVPYRDFFIEYPPGALAAIVPPALVTGGPGSYGHVFVAGMLAVLAATIAVTALTLERLAATRRRVLLSLAPLALAPALLGSVAGQRYDLLPALLTAVVLLLAVCRLDVAAAVALALAFATKLYPVLLLPVVLVPAWQRGGARRAAGAVAAFLVAALVVVVPFAVLSPGGVWHMARYQLARPLQMETLGASLALAAHAVAGVGVGLTPGHGSTNLGGSRGDVIGAVQGLVALVLFAWLCRRCLLRARDGPGAVLCAAAITCSAVVLGHVLSPQYLIWLLPVVPLVGGTAGVVATLVLLVASGLTRLWYERFYGHVIQELERSGIGVLVLRNGVLLVLLVVLVAELARPAPPAVGARL